MLNIKTELTTLSLKFRDEGYHNHADLLDYLAERFGRIDFYDAHYSMWDALSKIHEATDRHCPHCGEVIE